MSPLKITIDDLGIKCRLADTHRYFFHNMDIKFDAHGFRKLNAVEIITNKLNAKDFASKLENDCLTLSFDVFNGGKQMVYFMHMYEIYPELQPAHTIPLEPEANKIENILKVFTNKINSMDMKINELSNTVDELTRELNEYKLSQYKLSQFNNY